MPSHVTNLLYKEGCQLKARKGTTACRLLCPMVASLMAGITIWASVLISTGIKNLNEFRPGVQNAGRFSADSINEDANCGSTILLDLVGKYTQDLLYPVIPNTYTKYDFTKADSTTTLTIQKNNLTNINPSMEDLKCLIAAAGIQPTTGNSTTTYEVNLEQRKDPLVKWFPVENKDSGKPTFIMNEIVTSWIVPLQYYIHTTLYYTWYTGQAVRAPLKTVMEQLHVTLASYPITINFRALFFISASEWLSFAFIPLAMFPAAQLVTDKKLKVREMMKIMGLRDYSYYATHIIVMMIFAIVSSAGTIAALMIPQEDSVIPGEQAADAGTSIFGIEGLATEQVPVLRAKFVPQMLALCAAYSLNLTMLTLVIGAVVNTVNWAYIIVVIYMYLAPGDVIFFSLKWGASAQIVLAQYSPVGFTYGVLSLIGGENSEIVQVSAGVCSAMMCVNSLFLLLLAWYLSHVFPSSEWGVKRPLYFLFTADYWNSVFGKEQVEETRPLIEAEDQELDEGFEARVYNNGEEGNQEDPNYNPVMLELQELIKIYKGTDVRSVDRLSFKVFKGEIYCLLGHNGAGKSTTIHILTGLIEPTRYQVATIRGYDITRQMDMLRRHIGVCPQHDVLFDDLTAGQHMKLFGALKGVPAATIRAETAELLELVGLNTENDSTKTIAKFSGGMKRKLSLAIALIGKPSLIFLDEPTSGMDPVSRRVIWEALQKIKEKGISVVLTTHYMEEADILGDVIGIMFKGKMHCCGTSIFLKKHFGVGYYLKLDAPADTCWPDDVVQRFTEMVHHFVPGASCEQSNSNEPPTYCLPVTEVSSFPALFEAIDEWQIGNGGLLQGYGIHTNTLEDVFISISAEQERREDERHRAIVAHQESGHVALEMGGKADPDDPPSPAEPSKTKGDALSPSSSSSPHSPTTRNTAADAVQDRLLQLDLSQKIHNLALLQMKALLWRRFKLLIRSPSDILWYILVLTMIIVPIFIAEETNSDTFRVKNPDLQTLWPFKAKGKIAVVRPEFDTEVGRIITTMESLYPHHTWTNYSTYQALKDTTPPTDYKDFQPPFNGGFMFASANLSDPLKPLVNVTIQVNSNSQYRDVPMVLQDMLFTAIAHLTAPNSATKKPIVFNTTLSHFVPDPDAVKSKIVPSITDTGGYYLISLAFICGFSVMVNVAEIRGGLLLMMKTTGMSEYTFWLSTVAWDLIMSVFAYIALNIVVYAGGAKQLQGASMIMVFIATMLAVLCISLGFCIATHLFGEYFRPYVFFAAVLAMHAVGMFLPSLFAQVLHKDVQKYVLMGAYYATPQAIYAKMIDLLQTGYLHDNTYTTRQVDVYATSTFGYIWTYSDSLHYYQATLIAAQMMWITCLAAGLLFFSSYSSGPIRPIFFDHAKPLSKEEDDVTRERVKLAADKENDDCNCTLVGFQKRYGTKCAVKSVSLGIRQGECFGLLGPNGAGKTSTIKVLLGDTAPTRGSITIAGMKMKETDKKQLYRKGRLAVCPQDNVLWDRMTASEHLALLLNLRYGSLITKQEMEIVITDAIQQVGLSDHNKKTSSAFSGGMKRKLAVAMAMFTGGRIIFLDEPSTGMDPFSRRSLWKLIHRNLTPTKCIILTTHSMEEADNVCNRIGILFKGALQCLGSPQHLKEKYGGGYTLETKFVCNTNNNKSDEREKDPEDTEPEQEQQQAKTEANDKDGAGTKVKSSTRLLKGLQGYFHSEITILEEYGTSCKLGLGKLPVLSDVFKLIEKNKLLWNIGMYSVAQTTSLEQIFLKFTMEDGEDVVDDDALQQAALVWKTAKAEEHDNKTYWFHKTTREVTWEKPEAVVKWEKRLEDLETHAAAVESESKKDSTDADTQPLPDIEGDQEEKGEEPQIQNVGNGNLENPRESPPPTGTD